MVALVLAMIAPAAAAAPKKPVSAPPGASGQPTYLPKWKHPTDPPPLVTAEYLEVGVVREKGKLRVTRTERRRFAKPQAITPRFRGRFEAKLFSPTGQLRDVIRFDLPLTAASDEGASTASTTEGDPLGRKLSLGASGRVTVKIPFDASIAAVTIYDTIARASVGVELSRVRKAAPPPPAPALPPSDKLRTGSFRGGSPSAAPKLPKKVTRKKE